ncbi:hypothetical protein Tco_0242790 [Tanacetum coccineum]
MDNLRGPRIWSWKSNIHGFELNKGLWHRFKRGSKQKFIQATLATSTHLKQLETKRLAGFQSTSKYNIILGRTSIQNLSMKVLSIRSIVEFPTEARVAIVRSDYPGRDETLAAIVEEGNIREIAWKPIPGDTLKE